MTLPFYPTSRFHLFPSSLLPVFPASRLHIFTLLLLTSFPLFLPAQTTVGRWGKVSDEDMAATSYQFAPRADAIYLFDYGQWVPQNLEQGSARLAHHYQIKILTEEGLRYAERIIRFAKDERVSGLRAQVHYLDPEKGKHRKNLLKVGSLPDSTLSAASPGNGRRIGSAPSASTNPCW